MTEASKGNSVVNMGGGQMDTEAPDEGKIGCETGMASEGAGEMAGKIY